jgi:RNA polymerase sigma-70 factor (ECF subfamily)
VLRLVSPREGGLPSIEALVGREPEAVAQLYDLQVERVERLVVAVMGPDRELDDIVQRVFVEVLDALPRFRGTEEGMLVAFVDRITVNIARTWIRRRKRHAWLQLVAPAELPEIPTSVGDPRTHAALQVALRILDALPADERIAFGLRRIEGRRLEEIAEIVDASLATVKRRIDRAEQYLVAKARTQPLLWTWLEDHDTAS